MVIFMATSEDDIRKAVSLLLDQYGSLETSEVKKLLETVMVFDEDDLTISNTRNETLIKQRIGNVVSHQVPDTQTYYNRYQIDKSTKPAIWSSLSGLKTNGTLETMSQQELNEIKDIRAQFVPKKLNWTALNDGRDILGLLGEKFAYRYETNRVMQFAQDDLDRIIHLSEEQGDGAGFDILSVNSGGNSRYIEVKTTKGNIDTPFYMTENERKFFELHKDRDDSFIYRVYNFNSDNSTGDVEIISAYKLFSSYKFNPVTYKVEKNSSY